MEYILYFVESCPDTAPFKEKLSELGILYSPFLLIFIA